MFVIVLLKFVIMQAHTQMGWVLMGHLCRLSGRLRKVGPEV